MTHSSPKRRRLWLKRLFVAVAAALVLALYPVKRVLELVAEPSGPKDCPPLTPEPGTSATTKATIDASASATLSWTQKGGTLNDASCLNRTSVFGVVQVSDVDDVARAMRFAREAGLKLSVAGVRHSMGGQAFARGAVVLDMTRFNRMSLDRERRVLTVQSGATWHDVQRQLHPHFAVIAMQSVDMLTVGGSIAVNAHGMDHRAGGVGRTIRAMRVMLPDGTVRNVTRESDARLFNAIVGGYGLFGVILDVDLDVTPNVIYRSERRLLDYRQFTSVLRSEILPDRRIGLMYAHLSSAPQSLLREVLLYTYREVDAPGATIPQLGEVGQVKLRRLVVNAPKLGSLGARLKWFAEKHLEPRFESCPVTRNQALGEGEACLVSRNDPMHDSVPYLYNDLKRQTDILQEYFVPAERLVEFVDGLRERLNTTSSTFLNAALRYVPKEDNLLTYAPDDRVGVVLYFGQSADQRGTEDMIALTRDLIDLSTRVGGRFFLPYQLHYTPEQLEKAYPEIRDFVRLKREIDPDELLTNSFYQAIRGHL